jgi:hypothetical protein
LICASAAADSLAEARRQAAELDFTVALGTVRAALEAGDAEPRETTAIHAFTGELAAALGDRELARAEFGRALELDPSFDLPGASPRIGEPLSEARKQVASKALTVSVSSTQASDGMISTSVSWAGDFFSLAAAGRVWVDRAGQWVAVEDPKRWACTDPCRYWAAAVDGHGNQLARAGGPDAPLTLTLLGSAVAATTSAQPQGVVTAERRWFERAGPYLVASALVFVGLAVGFGVRFQQEQAALLDVEAHRAQHTMAEALALDSGRQRDQLLMFGALAFAGAIAVVGAFTW